MRAVVMALVAVAALAGGGAAQSLTDLNGLLDRVSERIAEYYRRAQNVICTEKSTVQPIGHSFSPEGFARTVESELRIEPDAEDGDGSSDAKVVREIRKINGRAPRERDKKDRSGCTDPNPLSPEPLAFLLPAHRSEYRFERAYFGKGKEQHTLIVDFTSAESKRRSLDVVESKKGIDDCYNMEGDVPEKGRIWIDPRTYQVLKVERRMLGPVDLRVSRELQNRRRLADQMMLERYDTTIRYKIVEFHDPDETLLLPESIDMLIVHRGGFESTRRSQTFSDYRRFVTGARLVK